MNVYGSGRLGIWKRTTSVVNLDSVAHNYFPKSGDSSIFIRGNKLFELTNHLGNVLATISDKRYAVSIDDSTVVYYNPEVVSANDYYPFGMMQYARAWTEPNAGNYRFGFIGRENDNEVKGIGNQQDFGTRIYDPRVGMFLSVDPLFKKYSFSSPYVYAGDNPVAFLDVNGQGPDLPPVYVGKALAIEHPVSFVALLVSVNTSPNEFYKWVTGTATDPYAYNKFRGAFGEAEAYTRLLSDWDINRGGLGIGAAGAPSTSIGGFYRGMQVDIQAHLSSGTTRYPFITVRRSVAIKNYSFEGERNKDELYGREKDAELYSELRSEDSISQEPSRLPL